MLVATLTNTATLMRCETSDMIYGLRIQILRLLYYAFF